MRQQQVSGLAASMTTLAMGLGAAVALGDLRILSANISIVRVALGFSPGTTIFVSSLATLTLAASVLGAGVLGDRYGMKRMFLAGACGAAVFGLLGAAAPNVVVLMIARACIGVAFAFLMGLSLAIINAVFPPDRRARAIAGYLAAVYALGVVPSVIGSQLAEQFGWRSGLLVTPVLAILVVIITVRYVPETQSSHRGTDFPGVLLVAVSLIGVMYGITRLQSAVNLAALLPIAAGLLAGAAFVWWELRCDDPALDMRIFRSPRFNAVVIAGVASNLVNGGAMIMVTFFLVIVRGQPTLVVALLLIPATLLSAVVALGAGRAAARYGDCAVVVAGLVVLSISLLVRLWFSTSTPVAVVGAVIALTAIGGAIVQTPQTTVMMSSAPANLGGVVSAVKSALGGVSAGVGGVLFSTIAIMLAYRDLGAELAGTGISVEQAGEILGGSTGAADGVALDAAREQWVVGEATSSVLGAAHALNLMMALIPVCAAVAVLILFRRPASTVGQANRVDAPNSTSTGR